MQELHLVLHVQHLSGSTESKTAVEEQCMLSYGYMGWLGSSHWESLLVKSTLEWLRRMFAKPKVWKEPVAADMLKAMVEAAGSAPSLTEVRLCLIWHSQG